jgi:signal transduction histidine kinase
MRWWPRSLKGQMLLAVALALLLAQTFHAIVLYRTLSEQRESALIHTAAFRLLRAARNDMTRRPDMAEITGLRRISRIEQAEQSPLQPGELRDAEAESELKSILIDQDVDAAEVLVVHRDADKDPVAHRRGRDRDNNPGNRGNAAPERLLIAAIRLPGSNWFVARVFVPFGERIFIASLIGQTLMIYAVLVGAIALILRRITKPLATLTSRVQNFAETRDSSRQIAPQGPDDIRQLIVAHNAMEGRISALLDEKDVMLGAIGHDLKTPLAALRVRIESVEDDTERSRMAATIDDISRSLDDILSLARTAHARGPGEPTELSALLGSVVDEYEDLGAPVSLDSSERIVLPVHPTWLRRAIRNLIDNALRYGQVARVSLIRDGAAVVLRVEDNGPGIADRDMARMQEPFTRGEPSRNSETGGAGLGLALARAIAEQHGGVLMLTNRHGAGNGIAGLTAELRLTPD